MKRDFIKKAIKILLMITSTIYIIWRIGFTLPMKFSTLSIIFGVIYLVIDVIEYLEFLIHYVNILSFNGKNNIKTKKLKDKEYEDVDVLIATINEEKSVIEKTIKACLKIEYPKKEKIHIYICDDGNRNAIKSLAEKYKVGYITREDNKDAKAGNYNNALKHIKSKYILTLDADMVPEKNILKEIMPYFVENEEVGFVQTPQAFYNLDIFQSRFGVKNRIPFDQNFFYHQMQPAKEKINATVYCGTNAVILRQALDDIGGFALDTLTEDIATGMLIEGAGYQGIYLDKVLTIGHSSNNIDSFIRQRKRWAAGCIQMEDKYDVFKQKGLSFRQKIEYISCVSYWFFPIKIAMYLVAPFLYSMFDIVIISSYMHIFLLMWLPQYILKRFLLDMVYDHGRSSTWYKIYETILFPALFFTCIKEALGIKNKKFEVTEKNNKNNVKNKTGIMLFGCHIIFIMINVIAYTKSMMIGQILPMIFSCINIIYLLFAVIFDLNNRTEIEENKNKLNTEIKYSWKSFLYIFKEIKI